MSTTPGPNPLLALTPSQVNWAQSEQWRQVARQLSTDMRSAIPGFLTEDMNVAEQTVTVQVAIQERVRVANSPKAQWWDVPPIVHVPIMVPRGGGYSITLPLKKGDEGMLIFCDACIDNWWANGQTNSPVASNTGVSSGSQRQNEVRRHYVHDCGFYPGLWSQRNLLADYSADSLQIRSDDGNTLVDIGESGITAFGDNVEFFGNDTVAVSAPVVTVGNGGTTLPLMNDTFYQWYVANIQPFLVSKGYAGPPVPAGSETTVLQGQ